MPHLVVRLALVVASAPLLAGPVSAQQPVIASRKLTTPLPTPRGSLRVLIYHDMEGLAGEDDTHQFRFAHFEAYSKGQELLVADINAVVAGLYDGGATSVDVVDAHGSGNPEPDVRRDLLDARAQQVMRDKPFRHYVDIVEPNKYDAVVAVGMHAKTGSRGFASHTITIGMDVIMNGQSITESEIVGYSWGRVGVPLILVTGDDRLQNDLKTMPWLEFVQTKRATSASTVELRPVDQVHAEMRAAAKRALERRAQAKVMTLTTPVRAALHAVAPASLESLKDVPGLNYHDNRVDFVGKDFMAAYEGVNGLIAVARSAYSQVTMEMLRERPDAKAVLLENMDRVFTRWVDVESGRWTAPPVAAPMAGKKYHGAN